MESSSIPPEDLKDGLILSNHSTLRGLLHLQDVTHLWQSEGDIFQFSKEYAHGEIYDLEIQANAVDLVVTWEVWVDKKCKTTDMIEYKFHAKNIFWENLPFLVNCVTSPIEFYQGAFTNGRIFQITEDDGKIEISLESVPIQEDINFPISNKRTIKGDLVFNWVKSIKIDDIGYLIFPPMYGEAEILKFAIAQHFIQLEIRWLNPNPITKDSSMKIKIEFGALYMTWPRQQSL